MHQHIPQPCKLCKNPTKPGVISAFFEIGVWRQRALVTTDLCTACGAASYDRDDYVADSCVVLFSLIESALADGADFGGRELRAAVECVDLSEADFAQHLDIPLQVLREAYDMPDTHKVTHDTLAKIKELAVIRHALLRGAVLGQEAA